MNTAARLTGIAARVWPVASLGLAAAMLALPPAAAQPYEQVFGPYTLRSSVVSSERIAEATARNHGIEPGPHTGVLNVVLLLDKQGTRWPVRAAVKAQRVNLAGVVREIEMREVANRGRVSYVGSFDFVPREVLDFTITAEPDTGDPPMSMTYRERMNPTQLPPATR